MPSSTEILESLQRIVSEGSAYALAWHVVLGAALLGVLRGRRSPAPFAPWLVVALFASVSAFAWRFDNPFNGSVFAVLAGSCALLTSRPSRAATQDVFAWARPLGGLMLAFGWVYPHFVEARTALSYLYAAPTGLIPCPTLSIALGFALLGWLPGHRGWSAILAGAASFYALFGVLRLGVVIDLGLLAGGLGLIVLELAKLRRGAPRAA
jgi:hypothetical protein